MENEVGLLRPCSGIIENNKPKKRSWYK